MRIMPLKLKGRASQQAEGGIPVGKQVSLDTESAFPQHGFWACRASGLRAVMEGDSGKTGFFTWPHVQGRSLVLTWSDWEATESA